MLFIIILILFTATSANQIIAISICKVLHLPKGSYSSLDVVHKLDKMDEAIFRSITTLSITPSQPFSNQKFDVYRGNQTQVGCYLNNLNQVQYLYQNNRSCLESCHLNAFKTFINNYTEEFNGNGSQNEVYLIIDNSQSPCQNGAYYPQVDLYQQLKTTIEPNMNYFYLYKALILVIVILILVFGTTNSIMWVQLKNKRKKLNETLIKTQNRENLDVIYTKIKEKQEIWPENEQPNRKHSNSVIMMGIN